MAFEHLKVRPLSRATSAWANSIVDALNQLYGDIRSIDAKNLDIALLSALPYDIIPDEALKRLLGQVGREWLAVYAGTGFFTNNVYIQGKRALKDGDPITLYDIAKPARRGISEAIDTSSRLAEIYGILREPLPRTLNYITESAKSRITEAIDSSTRLAEIREQARSIRDYTRHLPGMDTKLSDIREYTKQTQSFLARIYVDSQGRVGVTVLQPIDTYGNVLVRSVESIAKPFFRKKIEEGKAFSISRRFEEVASGASVSIYFENPPYSGVNAHIQMIEVVSMAQAFVDIYRDATKTAVGTPLSPFNLNMASPRTSKINAEYGGTYENGELALNTVCPGGSGVRAVGGAVEVGENLIIPPGRNIVVVVTNASASDTNISIRFLWYEE